MSIVAALGLVLNVSNRNGNTTLALLGSLVDLIEGLKLSPALEGEDLGDSGRGGRLAMVNVTDGADVYVWLATIELLLGHCHPPSGNSLLAALLKLDLLMSCGGRNHRLNSGTGDWIRTSDIAGMSRVL